MTALYERRIPTREELDIDRDTMLRWIASQRGPRVAPNLADDTPQAAEFIRSLEEQAAAS
jgi:hypothetical protein